MGIVQSPASECDNDGINEMSKEAKWPQDLSSHNKKGRMKSSEIWEREIQIVVNVLQIMVGFEYSFRKLK